MACFQLGKDKLGLPKKEANNLFAVSQLRITMRMSSSVISSRVPTIIIIVVIMMGGRSCKWALGDEEGRLRGCGMSGAGAGSHWVREIC